MGGKRRGEGAENGVETSEETSEQAIAEEGDGSRTEHSAAGASHLVSRRP